MLVGYDKAETWDRIWHRFNRMVELGIEPYPMVYDRSRKDLCAFQRWVITGLYRAVPWEDYREARVHKMAPGPDRWKERSRTYPGIAADFAAQWGATTKDGGITP